MDKKASPVSGFGIIRGIISLFFFFVLATHSSAQSPYSKLDEWMESNAKAMGGRSILVICIDGQIVYTKSVNDMNHRQKSMNKYVAGKQGEPAVLDDCNLTSRQMMASCSKWDGGAIIIRQDSLNWIKFCFEKDYTGAKRVVSVVTKNISDDCNSVEIMEKKVYYKIAKADNVITLYFSTEGKKCFLVRHLQFDTVPGFEVGFLAQSPTSKFCAVKFSNISYQLKKIKDP